jgi:biopolymer transport protein ExbB
MYEFLVHRLRDAFVVFHEGGVMMIPLLLSSIVALAVGIELALTLRRSLIMPKDLVRRIGEIESPGDVDRTLAVCHETPSPLANVMKVALMNQNLARHENQEAVLFAGRQEASAIGRGLLILEIIAATSPLMGLLGTVLGIVHVFDVVSRQEGLGHASMLSGGIKEALYTTVAGLSIAIPSLIAHSFFTKRVDDFVLDMERYATMLLTKLYSPRMVEQLKSVKSSLPPAVAEKRAANVEEKKAAKAAS